MKIKIIIVQSPQKKKPNAVDVFHYPDGFLAINENITMSLLPENYKYRRLNGRKL